MSTSRKPRAKLAKHRRSARKEPEPEPAERSTAETQASTERGTVAASSALTGTQFVCFCHWLSGQKLFAGLSLFTCTFQSLRRARRAHRDRRRLEPLGHGNAPREPPQQVGRAVCLSHSASEIWPNTHSVFFSRSQRPQLRHALPHAEKRAGSPGHGHRHAKPQALPKGTRQEADRTWPVRIPVPGSSVCHRLEGPQAHPLPEQLPRPEESVHREQACGGPAHAVDRATACGGLHQVSLPSVSFHTVLHECSACGYSNFDSRFRLHGSHGQERPDRTPEQDETPLPLAAQALHEVSRLGRLQRLHHHGFLQTSLPGRPPLSHLPHVHR